MRNRHLLLLDLMLLSLLPFLVMAIRSESLIWPANMSASVFAYAALALPIRIGVAYGVGIYRMLWRHASLVELERLLFVSAVSGVLTFITGAVLIRGLGLSSVRMPLSALLLDALMASAFMIGPRLAIRFSTRTPSRTRRAHHRAIVIGAGGLGQTVLRDFAQDGGFGSAILPVAFVDDDPAKRGQMLGGLSVVGCVDELPAAIASLQATEVLIAVPGVRGSLVRRVVELCLPFGITPRMVPGVRDVLDGRVGLQTLRKVAIEDLLRRDPIVTDLAAVGRIVSDRVVLVTGAGGSIGSELCRQIAALDPSTLVILDHSENQVFEIHNELQRSFPNARFVPVIADLRHARRVQQVFDRHHPVAVFHAAAHKHVPLMEENVSEAVTNNVLGTANLVNACVASAVDTFVLISTDKAVRPTSIMGCSKRVAEQIVRAAADRTGRNFLSVRFGNVLGSRGSVIPTFLKQIESGGPVTITHPEMRRYFMTIPEAVQLVLQAGAMGRSGELFVLDMGEPVKIVDLARDLIRLSGLEEGVDIDIAYSGIRPGEKLYEEVFFGHEAVEPTTHPKVLRSPIDPVDARTMDLIEDMIQQALGEPDDWESLRTQLRQLVPDFSVPPPPPPLDRPDSTSTRTSGERERRLRLA